MAEMSTGQVNVQKFGIGLAPIARGAAVTAPTGGTADVEGRVAINLIITRLEAFGLITEN